MYSFREGGGTVPIRRCIKSGKEDGQYLSGDVFIQGKRGLTVPIKRCINY
jgi:hypothetical protein